MEILTYRSWRRSEGNVTNDERKRTFEVEPDSNGVNGREIARTVRTQTTLNHRVSDEFEFYFTLFLFLI